MVHAKNRDKKLLLALMIVLGIGILISLFLVYEHYTAGSSPFCTFGNDFDCGIVNESPYSTIDGIFYLMAVDWGWNVPIPNIPIPVAAMGTIVLGIMIYLSYALYRGKKVPKLTPRQTLYTIRGVLIASALFGGYLFLVQKYLLMTWCIFCLGLDTTIIISLVLSFIIRGDRL